MKIKTLLSSVAVIAAFAQVTASDAVVTTDWLANNLESRNIRVAEVSIVDGLYEEGHIPGAANISWHTDLVDNPNRDIVTKENFEKLMSRLGVTPDTTVVLYGDHDNWFAAWGVWIFKVYGHDNVKLLDGGRRKWLAEDRPLDTIAPDIRPTEYKVTQVNLETRARLTDVVAVAEGREEAHLVDIRSPDEFQGRVFAPAGIQELSIRAGHVPGAVNVPWVAAVNPADGTFRSKEELQKIYADKGVDGSKPAIVYCRIGERSAHTWFVLSQILGYEVKQYDGSWTEYGNAVGVPINNPAGTVWTGK
ncbi:MAG: sulfurtransferase [Verrucomicrobia bacterium]|nr:sulfurtransferase [Verrucomicrobiota bacterium]MCH8512670.1 sulfurtransferase [Kiritimatiellia bacterium]